MRYLAKNIHLPKNDKLAKIPKNLDSSENLNGSGTV